MDMTNSTAGGGNGICCEVKNCAYHQGQDNCTAQSVQVGPQFANSSAETVCSTFRPKN